MADQISIVRYSEVVPIQSGTFTPDAGNEDLENVGVILYDAQGNVAGGVSQAASGFVGAASAAPYAWYVIGPKAAALPVPATFQDVYTLWFLATDVNGGRYESNQTILVRRDGT